MGHTDEARAPTSEWLTLGPSTRRVPQACQHNPGGALTATDRRPESTGVVTPGAFRIPCLDGLRAVAVLLVFIGHAGLPTLVGAGTGVTMFFFLSGYLITSLLRREHAQTGRISIRDFYIRRGLRILPPLYVFLAIAVVLTLVGAIAGGIHGAGVAAALLHYTNFMIIFGHSSDLIPGTGVLWSLAIEEHFYLIFPLLYLFLLRAPRKWQGIILASACSLTLAWRCIVVFLMGGTYDRTYYGTDTRADALLMGCLLAVIANPVLDRMRLRRKVAFAVLLVGGGLVVLGEHLPTLLDASVGPTVQNVGLLLAFMAILSVPQSFVGRILEWGPMARLGVLSYTFYLFHGLVLQVVESHTSWGVAPRALLAIAVTVAIGEAIHVAVERPLARL